MLLPLQDILGAVDSVEASMPAAEALAATVAASMVAGAWLHWGGKSNSTATDSLETLETSTEAPSNSLTDIEPVGDSVDVADRLIRDGRAALGLNLQFADELNESQRQRLRESLTRRMAHIHPGRVRLESWTRVAEHDERGGSRIESVDAFWMDRAPVTNQEFARFVAAGGYQADSPWWPEEAKPLVSQFVDRSGSAGPADWHDSQPSNDRRNHPVVGVSWYEARAYATWAGKRLPTDPEWLKAATWPIDSCGNLSQRVFPWGDQLHSQHAHLWREEATGPVSVDDFATGANPAGVRQLIGNVWEWMHDAFGEWDEQLPFPHDGSLVSIRGGAFDTYFQSHATAQFFSAEPRVERRANIGFRCVVPACHVNIEHNG